MKSFNKGIIIGCTLFLSTIVFANPVTTHDAIQPVLPDANTIVWKKMPNMPGVKYSELTGNPNKKGFFVARVKFPANYTVSPHFHPVNEYDTIISGTYFYGTGKKMNIEKGMPLPAGAYVYVPAKSIHYGWTKEETVVQVSGYGPWAAIYLKS